MKFILSLFFALLLITGGITLDNLRDFYPQASASKASADKFQNMAAKAPGTEPEVLAYRSASKIIQAKFEKGPSRKPMLVDGIKGLENIISRNPKNIELRVIRLSVQENLPKIVGYHTKITEDKGVIIRNYAYQNASLKQFIREFATVSKTMTAAEKATLK